MSISSAVVKCTMVGALGGLLFGFDTAVISGTTAALTAQYNLSSAMLGFTVASALWGTVIGAIFSSIPGQRFGRRDSLVFFCYPETAGISLEEMQQKLGTQSATEQVP